MTERERLIELLNNKIDYGVKVIESQMDDRNNFHDIKTNDLVADYLLENGVIVPPVMSGQKVYLLRSLMNDVIEGEVTGLKTTEFSKYAVVFLIDDNRYTEIPFVAYGKTVFLTKEEAEQALKARGKE